METFAQDTYWLFGSEACSICRSHKQYRSWLRHHLHQSCKYPSARRRGVDEVANKIIHDSNIFSIHISTPRSVNYAMDLLYAYDGWEDYEQIDKDLYDILKIYQIKNKDYSHEQRQLLDGKKIVNKLNK